MMAWLRKLLARIGLFKPRREPDALEQLAAMIEAQHQSLLAVRASVAETVRARKKAADQARGMADAAARLEQQAREALAAGDETRARELLVQCEANEQHQAALAPDVQRLADAEQRLLTTVRDTELRIEQLSARQQSLQGARDSATAQAQLAQLRGELDAGTSQIGATMAQAEEDAMRAELHAAALRELEQSTAPAELPTDAPAALMPGAGDVLRAGISERLARLKDEVSLVSRPRHDDAPARQSTPSAPPAQPIAHARHAAPARPIVPAQHVSPAQPVAPAQHMPAASPIPPAGDAADGGAASPPSPTPPPAPAAPAAAEPAGTTASPARDPLRTRMPPPPPPADDD